MTKMGRPTAPDGKRERDLRVRVSDEMYQRILDHAKGHGKTISETVREALNNYIK